MRKAGEGREREESLCKRSNSDKQIAVHTDRPTHSHQAQIEGRDVGICKTSVENLKRGNRKDEEEREKRDRER
jgi:hypothetical protein